MLCWCQHSHDTYYMRYNMLRKLKFSPGAIVMLKQKLLLNVKLQMKVCSSLVYQSNFFSILIFDYFQNVSPILFFYTEIKISPPEGRNKVSGNHFNDQICLSSGQVMLESYVFHLHVQKVLNGASTISRRNNTFLGPGWNIISHQI